VNQTNPENSNQFSKRKLVFFVRKYWASRQINGMNWGVETLLIKTMQVNQHGQQQPVFRDWT